MTSSLISDDLVPETVVVDDSMIRVKFNGGLEIATPVSRFPRLANANSRQRSNWRRIGRGDGIHWPEVDEDISVRTLLSKPPRKPATRMEQVPSLIGDLLRTTARLNQLFRGRMFTPDGHLVGSIGEVVAEYVYDLILTPGSTPQIDAYTRDGKSVQIKLTGSSNRYAFRWSSLTRTNPADVLIALRLSPVGFEEIYNGPFPTDLLANRKDTSNGQLSIGIAKLRQRNPGLLKCKQQFASLNAWFTPEIADVA